MKTKRFWWKLERRRGPKIAVLFVLFVIMVGIVTWQILHLLNAEQTGSGSGVEDRLGG